MSRVTKLIAKAKIDIPKRVQDPPAGPFSASDVEWELYVAKNQPGKPVFQALVPIHRTEDFISGEKLRGPSNFCKQDWKENASGALTQPQLYSFRRSQDYTCEYGPEDHRKGAVEVSSCKPKSGKGMPSCTIVHAYRPVACYQKFVYLQAASRSLVQHGEGRKRGCQAKFTIQQLYLAPEVARIFYHSLEHENKEGLPCHGRKDPTANGTRHELAAGLSPFMRQWVDEQVLQEVFPLDLHARVRACRMHCVSCG